MSPQVNPLIPGGNKKVTHTETIKYAWPLLPPGIKELKEFYLHIKSNQNDEKNKDDF